MTEVSRSIEIAAAPERVFSFVSDVANLPRFVPTVRSAEATEQGKVHVEGEVHGQHYADDGHIYTDPERKLMRWGSGKTGYRGELMVDPAGGGSRVAITLHFHDASDAPPREDIDASLGEALARLQSALD